MNIAWTENRGLQLKTSNYFSIFYTGIFFFCRSFYWRLSDLQCLHSSIGEMKRTQIGSWWFLPVFCSYANFKMLWVAYITNWTIESKWACRTIESLYVGNQPETRKVQFQKWIFSKKIKVNKHFLFNTGNLLTWLGKIYFKT